MAMVRDLTSPKPVILGSQYPTRPPIRWRRRTGSWEKGECTQTIGRKTTHTPVGASDTQVTRKLGNAHLQSEAGAQDRIDHLRHGARHKQAGGDDADHGSKGQDCLHEFGEELVGRHADGDGGEDHLADCRPKRAHADH